MDSCRDATLIVWKKMQSFRAWFGGALLFTSCFLSWLMRIIPSIGHSWDVSKQPLSLKMRQAVVLVSEAFITPSPIRDKVKVINGAPQTQEQAEDGT